MITEDQFLVVISAMALEDKIEIDGDEVNARRARVVRIVQERIKEG